MVTFGHLNLATLKTLSSSQAAQYFNTEAFSQGLEACLSELVQLGPK
jgi:hypothetical protein